MIYIFYNSTNGEVIKGYHDSCYPNIPTPNITINDSIWRTVQAENRECHVDLNTKQFVIGEVKPLPTNPNKYSKLYLIREMKKLNIWTEVKTIIEQGGMMDEWDACTFLADNDQMFLNMKATLVYRFPNVDVPDLLEKCKY